jgi:hypothetical protein
MVIAMSLQIYDETNAANLCNIEELYNSGEDQSRSV